MRWLICFALLSTQVFADSNIRGPKYEKIIQSMVQLSTASKGQAEFIEYGKSVSGRPLGLIKIYDQEYGGILKRKAVVVTGAHHGWEYLNIADRLPAWFLAGESETIRGFIQRGGVIYVVPIMNPDGYERRRRYNDNDFDLNRDYPLPLARHAGMTQPEISNFLKFLDRDLKKDESKLMLNLNYHCCGYGPRAEFLYPYAHTDLPSPHQKKFELIGKKVEKIFDQNNIASGQWGEMLYLRVGTATDYYYTVHRALAFNFEGSWGEEDKRLPQHKKMWEYLISLIL